MITTDIDARAMIASMTDLEKQSFPFAIWKALNDTAFQDVRPGWRDRMLQVFDRPKPLTLNAVLVKRARRNDPEAEIYLRDEAHKGTPPARYLIHQVEGGSRKRKPFESLLTQAGVMEPNEFAIPGKSYPLDPFGNVPARVVTAMLSDVKGSRAATEYSTPESRRRRERRRKKRGGLYFYSRGDRGLPRGIYERIRTAFGVGVRTVFIFATSARYAEQFDAYEVARSLFHEHFPERFEKQLRIEIQKSLSKNKAKGRSR